MTSLATLYSFRRCPYAIRARMALLVSGVPFVLHEVDLRDKPAELIILSAKATVPVLVLTDGQVIDESLDIMRWALRQSDPENWLSGADLALIETFDTEFKQHLDNYKYAARESLELSESRQICVAMLQSLEHRLAANLNLNRDARSFTDMAIFPFVRQFAAVDRRWFEAQPLPCVSRWLSCHLASPLFTAVMAK
jgi:glutathione S-transferase